MCWIHKPDFIFLCESEVPLFATQNPLARMGFTLLFQVPSSGDKGGLLVACKVDIDADLVVLNNHQISLKVRSDPSSSTWLVTCAHALSSWNDRCPFWKDIETSGAQFNGPWLLFGDFNTILSSTENKEGRFFGSPSHNVFLDFVHSNGLVDLGFSGNHFT